MTKNKLIALIVADTSPLIAIAIMELFPVLKKLFDQILVPESVVNECLHDLSKPYSTEINKALKDNILEQKTVPDNEYCQLLGQILDYGEAQAISLAKELNTVALIDEKAGRKIAQREGIDCIGSLYILIKAKQNNYVDSVVPLIKRLLKHGYYLDVTLIDSVLISCDEMNTENKIALSKTS